MISKYFNPYTDFGFKKLFGEEGSKDLLVDFLNQLLPDYHQINELSFKNPENNSDTSLERKAVFDIYCQSASGEKFIVERLGCGECKCLILISLTPALSSRRGLG